MDKSNHILEPTPSAMMGESQPIKGMLTMLSMIQEAELEKNIKKSDKPNKKNTPTKIVRINSIQPNVPNTIKRIKYNGLESSQGNYYKTPYIMGTLYKYINIGSLL